MELTRPQLLVTLNLHSGHPENGRYQSPSLSASSWCDTVNYNKMDDVNNLSSITQRASTLT